MRIFKNGNGTHNVLKQICFKIGKLMIEQHITDIHISTLVLLRFLTIY